MFSKLLLNTFIILVFNVLVVYSRVRFTNLECLNLDPTFSNFVHCKIIAVSRDVHYMSLKAVLFKLPINDFEVRVQLMKRANGWKPFLYDVTLKCNFTKKLNVLTRFGWEAVQKFSNVKHDCPYNQHFETVNATNVLVEKAIEVLPAPQGEYAIFTTWKAFNKTRATLNFYGEIV